MAKYFDSLYSYRVDTPYDLPLLAKYAGLRGTALTLAQARGIFSHLDTINYRCIPFGDSLGRDMIALASAIDDDHERFIYTSTCFLPIRVDDLCALQPYYPFRGSHQFGFDQAIPSDEIVFSPTSRVVCDLRDLAYHSAHLYRRPLGVVFALPTLDRVGKCTVG